MSGEKSPPSQDAKDQNVADKANSSDVSDATETSGTTETSSASDTSGVTGAAGASEASTPAEDTPAAEDSQAASSTNTSTSATTDKPSSGEDIADDTDDTDNTDEPIAEDAKEQAFFDGEGAEGGAEVEELLSDQSRAPGLEDETLWGSTHGPVVPPQWEFALPLGVVIISLFVMTAFWDDMRYFFSPRAPIQLGSAKEGCSPAMGKKMRHNRVASIKHVFAQPGMTALARVRFHKQNYVVAMGCNLILAIHTERFKKVEESYFSATGRLMNAKRSNATRALKKYYGPSGILSFGKETYIMYVGEHPNHQWWLAMIYLLLGALALYSAWRAALAVWRNQIKGTEGDEAT